MNFKIIDEQMQKIYISNSINNFSNSKVPFFIFEHVVTIATHPSNGSVEAFPVLEDAWCKMKYYLSTIFIWMISSDDNDENWR